MSQNIYIVTTRVQLRALDPGTLLAAWHPELDGGYICLTAQEWLQEEHVPYLVIIAAGSDFRAAHEALGKVTPVDGTYKALPAD